MKRSILVLILLLAVLMAVGILLLLWLDMRSSIPQRQEPKPSEGRREGERRERSRDAGGSRTKSQATCSDLGVVCSTEYLATWSWPVDGSCQTTVRNGYPEPDSRCTPGGVVPSVTVETLRDPNWRTKCVRDCQSSSAQKRAAYGWYGVVQPEGNSGEGQVCELDHLVPLELGGADGMGNLWPECGPEDVTLRHRYFKKKDIVENYLAARVRAGELPLEEAQRGIASDWVQYLEQAESACRGSPCVGGGN